MSHNFGLEINGRFAEFVEEVSGLTKNSVDITRGPVSHRSPITDQLIGCHNSATTVTILEYDLKGSPVKQITLNIACIYQVTNAGDEQIAKFLFYYTS